MRWMSLKSRREARDARMQRLADDGQQWSERKQAAGNHIEALAERQAASEEELSGYQHVPDNLAERRAKLADLLVEAEATRQKAADALAQAETKLGDADARVRETQAATAGERGNASALGSDAGGQSAAFAGKCPAGARGVANRAGTGFGSIGS